MNFNDNDKELYLVADRIRKIKMQIKYLQNKIDLNKSIISKFEKLPGNIKSGLNENMSNKSFISTYEKDISLYNNQLNNLYEALKELQNL